MANIEIEISFAPDKLRAFVRNESVMSVSLKNSGSAMYWCECMVQLSSPLSLASDSELNSGKMLIGMLKPLGEKSKKVKLYTRPNNYPDDYKFSVTALAYDEDGVIAERLERKVSISCVSESRPPMTQA